MAAQGATIGEIREIEFLGFLRWWRAPLRHVVA